MNVSLNPALARFIEDEVKRGRYSSPEEAVNAAVAHLRAAQEHVSIDEVAELRSLLDPAIAEADAGEFLSFSAEDVIASRRR